MNPVTQFIYSVKDLLLLGMFSVTSSFILEKSLICVISVAEVGKNQSFCLLRSYDLNVISHFRLCLSYFSRVQ